MVVFSGCLWNHNNLFVFDLHIRVNKPSQVWSKVNFFSHLRRPQWIIRYFNYLRSTYLSGKNSRKTPNLCLLKKLKTDYYLKIKIATKWNNKNQPKFISKFQMDWVRTMDPQDHGFTFGVYQWTNIGSWMFKVRCEWKISKCSVATKWEIMQLLFKYLLIRIHVFVNDTIISIRVNVYVVLFGNGSASEKHFKI